MTLGIRNGLALEPKPGGRWFEVLAPFQVRDHRGNIITVEAGFRTDLASVPRFFWRLWPPIGPYLEAAVVHDWLETRAPHSYSDKVFEHLMKRSGVGWFTRKAFRVGLWLADVVGMRVDPET